MPIVAVLLSDLLDVFESYDDDAMTIPVHPPEYAWPDWFPSAVLDEASNFVVAAVHGGGGIPAEMAVEQIRVHVGLGDSWQLTPEIAWKVKDEEGMGEVTQVRIAMRQADVRSWTRPQQETALRSAVAVCSGRATGRPPQSPDAC